MWVQVDSQELLRMLALIPIAPNQMAAEDFVAFVNVAGAAAAGIKEQSKIITAIRVTDQSVFHSQDNGYSPAKIGKVQTIKEIRAITGLGLKEAKDITDGVWVGVHMTAEQFSHLKKMTPGVSYEWK